MLGQGAFRLSADWSVAAGAKLALIGPSGAGKSTLLMGIAGFLPPSAGRITWQGQDLAGVKPGARPVTILFQDHNLFPHLTVTDNLGLSRRLTADQREQIEQILDQVGLSGLGQRKPGDLSGGQQGRVALARAILRARPILLLDEPFAALGPAMKADLLDLLARVTVGITVLMVTHDPNDAKRFADACVLVADGVAHPPVATKAFFDQPSAELRAYLG